MSDRAAANLFDPSLPEFQADPYPFYRRLQTEAPVYWDDSNQAWVLTRYADVGAILRERRFLTQKTFLPEGQFTAMQQVMERWMLVSDPPAHTRLRGLVTKAFTPRMVDGLRLPRLQLGREPPQWRKSIAWRGLEELPLTF